MIQDSSLSMDPDRHLTLQNAYNFRDIGGLRTHDGRRVQKGLLYRSDALSRLASSDQEAIAGLGLKTVVDLRTESERKSAPDRLGDDRRIRVVHHPMRDPAVPESRWRMMIELIVRGRDIDMGALLQRQYVAFAFDCGAALGAVVRLVAERAHLPLLIHCTAGKDRTGLVAAVILRMLGVSMDDVLDDHIATNELLRPAFPHFEKTLRRMSMGRLTPEQIRPLLEARAEDLEHVFRTIDERHGSIEGWLEQVCGIGAETTERIRQVLLTEP